MKRVTLDPLDARPEVPLSATPAPLADPLVDASRRARALHPVDPRVLGCVDVNARRPRTARWRVADPTPPDPKALDARVSALAADVAAALRRASDPSQDEAGTEPARSEPRPFPAADALGDAPASLEEKPAVKKASRFCGPIRFVERFPVVAPLFGEARAATNAKRGGLSYDAPSKTWTREVFPTGDPDPEAHTANSNAHTSREDVRVLERWLDTRVADAARRSEPKKNGERRTTNKRETAPSRDDERYVVSEDRCAFSSPSVGQSSSSSDLLKGGDIEGDPKTYLHLKAARETCDAAIDAFRATFETIARDVFTECRDRAALLRRVWGFNATFFELRGAAAAAPALVAATRDARAARASSRRSRAEAEALEASLRVADARARAAEEAREKQLDASRAQIFALTQKLRDVVHVSADARGASARACHRENALRETFTETRKTLVRAKRSAVESAWRSMARRAASRARENAARCATRVVAQAVGAGAACDATVCALVSETAEWEMETCVQSARAEAFVESALRLVFAERVAALERSVAFEKRVAENAVASAHSETRDARREATRWRAARDDARCMAREAREDSGNAKRALADARCELEAARGETRRLRDAGNAATARAESAESELAEVRRRLARADAESRRRDEVMRRARVAAAARDAAIAGLLAEVTVTEDIYQDIDDDIEDIENSVSRRSDGSREIREEDRVEDEDDRVLVEADARLASAANAAARLLREARASRDASLRETFELRTRFEHAANDAARSAAAAASSSAKLEACSAAREALDMKSRALTHRLANREAALERAATETEKTRHDADVVARTCAATRAANATLKALVSDLDARLATTRHELERSERSETQNVFSSLLVEVALETAHEETRDALAEEKAARVSERHRFVTELAVARRREEKTKARFAHSRRALRAALGARDALATEAVELELKWRAVADQRDDAASRARASAEEAEASRGELEHEKQRAERERAARVLKEARDATRRDEKERDRVSGDINALASAARALDQEFESTRDALLAAIASHRDAREETRARIRLEIEPVTAKVRDAAKKAKTRAARRRDASTQSDDAHSACGRRVEAKTPPRIPPRSSS